MTATESFDDLISTLYATVVDGDAWPKTLAAIRASFDCSIASLNTSRQGHYASVSTDPLASAEWTRHWTMGNPLNVRGLAAGSVALAGDIVDHDTFVASAYYNEFLLPRDIPKVMMIKGPSADNSGAVLNVLRGRHQPDFTPDDLVLGQRLSGHVVTAWRAASMLGWKSWTTLTASLEEAREAMILVDAAGAILHMNRIARALTEARDGIAVSGLRLNAAVALDGQRLGKAIWQATAGPEPRTGAMLPIARPSGARSLIASITPLPEAVVDFGVPRARALIAILDPAHAAPSPSVDLRRLFGLTRREEDVARALAEGLTIGEAAQRCGVTLTTARNYLARVLRKTDLNRQGDLVQLLDGLARLAEASRRT